MSDTRFPPNPHLEQLADRIHKQIEKTCESYPQMNVAEVVGILEMVKMDHLVATFEESPEGM